MNTPGSKKLEELLWGARLDSKRLLSDEHLFRDAVSEIIRLRELSITQSKNMAEALKEKNDALGRVVFKQTELDQRNKTLADQYKALQKANDELQHIRDRVPLRYLSLPDGLHAMIAAMSNDLYQLTQLDKLQALLAEKDVELVRASQELARYKPLEPKFRVGQVLVCTGNGTLKDFAVKLAAVSLAPYGVASKPPVWQYTDTVGRIWNAESLRPLTDDEK